VASGQGRGNVDQVFAGQNQNSACLSNAGRFQNFGLTKVAHYRSHAFQARTGRIAVAIDDDSGHPGGAQALQYPPPQSPQTAHNHRLIHGRSSIYNG